MNRFLINALPIVLLAADAAGGGSPGGATTTNPTQGATGVVNPDGTTTPGGAAVAEAEKRDATVVYPSLEALKAVTPQKTYRRYHVTGDDGREGFVCARQPREAVGAVAMANGWSVANIDRTSRAPLSTSDVDKALDSMTPEARAALLAKYLGGGATVAAGANPGATGATTPPAVTAGVTAGVTSVAGKSTTTPPGNNPPGNGGNKSAAPAGSPPKKK